MTKCNEYKKYFHDFVDRNLSQQRERTYKTHMAGCSICSEMYQQDQKYREIVNVMSPPEEMPSGADLRFRGRLQFNQFKDLRHEESGVWQGIDSDSGVTRWQRSRGIEKAPAAETIILMGKKYFTDELYFQEERK